MIIEQIDNSKVLIVLGGNDMQDFSLEYDTLSFDDPHSGKILKRLLTLACTKTGISTEDKKILVEAVPQQKGCVILLTLLPKVSRKIYRIKKQKTSLCFIFEDAEALISAAKVLCKSLMPPENSVYLLDDKYVVVIEGIIENKRYLSRLREFSHKALQGKIHSARVRENGKLLAEENGIKVIGKYFL